MKFLDSNILAYAFYHNEHTLRCQQLIREGGVINTLSLIEAFNIISHEQTKSHAIASIRSLLKSDLVIVETGINLIFEGLKKAEHYKKLSFADLIHLMTASLEGCEGIASFDSDFDGLDIPRVY
ncbi:type II toxin-antitoxin system VapC family toxin [Candidatus Woesearchaeota archaeon]|nr:type II toxin-antitoxin system VapC family toxin [Candidatus Woesearchaeota archaeon]